MLIVRKFCKLIAEEWPMQRDLSPARDGRPNYR